MNVFTTGFPEIYQDVIKELSPFATYEHNFQQIMGLAHSKELDHLCIFMDVWNISGLCENMMRGQGGAEKLHEINPDVPVLIWQGRQFDPPEFPGICAAFQCSGVLCPVKKPNELYLQYKEYPNMYEITKKFFDGSLTCEDVQKRDCLDFRFAPQVV